MQLFVQTIFALVVLVSPIYGLELSLESFFGGEEEGIIEPAFDWRSYAKTVGHECFMLAEEDREKAEKLFDEAVDKLEPYVKREVSRHSPFPTNPRAIAATVIIASLEPGFRNIRKQEEAERRVREETTLKRLVELSRWEAKHHSYNDISRGSLFRNLLGDKIVKYSRQYRRDRSDLGKFTPKGRALQRTLDELGTAFRDTLLPYWLMREIGLINDWSKLKDNEEMRPLVLWLKGQRKAESELRRAVAYIALAYIDRDYLPGLVSYYVKFLNNENYSKEQRLFHGLAILNNLSNGMNDLSAGVAESTANLALACPEYLTYRNVYRVLDALCLSHGGDSWKATIEAMINRIPTGRGAREKLAILKLYLKIGKEDQFITNYMVSAASELVKDKEAYCILFNQNRGQLASALFKEHWQEVDFRSASIKSRVGLLTEDGRKNGEEVFEELEDKEIGYLGKIMLSLVPNWNDSKSLMYPYRIQANILSEILPDFLKIKFSNEELKKTCVEILAMSSNPEPLTDYLISVYKGMPTSDVLKAEGNEVHHYQHKAKIVLFIAYLKCLLYEGEVDEYIMRCHDILLQKNICSCVSSSVYSEALYAFACHLDSKYSRLTPEQQVKTIKALFASNSKRTKPGPFTAACLAILYLYDKEEAREFSDRLMAPSQRTKYVRSRHWLPYAEWPFHKAMREKDGLKPDEVLKSYEAYTNDPLAVRILMNLSGRGKKKALDAFMAKYAGQFGSSEALLKEDEIF